MRVTTATSAHGCGCARTDVPRTCQTGSMYLLRSNGEDLQRSVWSAARTPYGCVRPTCERPGAMRWTGPGGTSSIFAGAGFHVALCHPLIFIGNTAGTCPHAALNYFLISRVSAPPPPAAKQASYLYC